MTPQQATDTRIDRRQTRDATEQRILDGTTRLLNDGASLAGLSVNRIAEESGVSRATFYLHFGDKRALIARLAETELRAFESVTDPFIDDPDAGRAKLAAVTRELAGVWRDHAGVLSSLIELAEYDADSREEWQTIIQAVAANIAPAVRIRRTDLNEAQVITLSEVIAWTGERSMHQMIGREASQQQIERVADGLTEAIWRIVAPAVQ
ncbi:MAG: TetR/AcrR family transcriptional regulator [Solirubrobacterales bacterium]